MLPYLSPSFLDKMFAFKSLKAGANEETLLKKQICIQIFCLQTMLCGGASEETFGNH